MSTEYETRIKAMEVLMGKPFGLEYSEDVLKTRRNLLAVGAISVLICSAGLTVQTAGAGGNVTPILGWPLTGMTQRVLLWSLIVLTTYLLLHFMWASIDAIHEYALRSTGLPKEVQYGEATWGPEGAEPLTDPRQSTLYSWWLWQSRQAVPLQSKIEEQKSNLDSYLSALEGYKASPNEVAVQHADVLRNAASIQQAIVNLQQSVKALHGTLSDPRLVVSLSRFDAAFRWRALSQNARWIVLEFGLPVVLGIAGILGALSGIFPRWWAICS